MFKTPVASGIDLTLARTLMGALDFDGTGGWQDWTTVSETIEIDEGTNLRLSYDGDSRFTHELLVSPEVVG